VQTVDIDQDRLRQFRPAALQYAHGELSVDGRQRETQRRCGGAAALARTPP